MVTVADNRLAEAIDVVARWALASALDFSLSHEETPNTGGVDRVAILARARAITDCPAFDEYEAAYEYLTARADNTEATP